MTATDDLLKRTGAIQTIDDREGYTQCTEYVRMIASFIKDIDAAHKPGIEQAHAAHKAALAKRDEEKAPLLLADKKLRAAMVAYDNHQEKLRRESEARRLAEAEAAEQARRLAEIERLEALREETGIDPTAAIEAIVNQPLEVVVEAPVKQTPKVEGVSYVKVWKWEITDKALIPREFLTVNESLITAHVKNQKGETSIPGIRAYEENTTRVKGY